MPHFGKSVIAIAIFRFYHEICKILTLLPPPPTLQMYSNCELFIFNAWNFYVGALELVILNCWNFGSDSLNRFHWIKCVDVFFSRKHFFQLDILKLKLKLIKFNQLHNLIPFGSTRKKRFFEMLISKFVTPTRIIDLKRNEKKKE